ncbi:MAG TPA: NADPH-dependent F420 reductase [Methanoregula sp.]|nr:NADPH-dependent F420 reductase [Methanoregula sp.]
MKIGIVGGTGDIGEGMAMRLSPVFDVVVGSREQEKADASCTVTRDTLKNRGQSCSVHGTTNQGAVDEGDIIVLAIPFKHVVPTLSTLHGFGDKIVISPVNPMEKQDHFVFVPPAEGSAALLIKKLLPKETRLCCAFNTIAANRWKALDEELTYSVPVCGDDEDAKKSVMGLVNQVSRLQAFNAGPLTVAPQIESLTPLVLNIARYNKMRDVGIQFR